MSLGRKMKTNIILTHNCVVHLRKRTMEEILGIKVTRLLVWRNGILFAQQCSAKKCCVAFFAAAVVEGRPIPGPIPDLVH